MITYPKLTGETNTMLLEYNTYQLKIRSLHAYNVTVISFKLEYLQIRNYIILWTVIKYHNIEI